jgi:hypothetical protein
MFQRHYPSHYVAEVWCVCRPSYAFLGPTICCVPSERAGTTLPLVFVDEEKDRRRAAREDAFAARERGLGGALPDFIIVGAQKGGTTSLYRLLTRHPLVERAATKEVHFFDDRFREGLGWYRSRFPAPKIIRGGKTVTGEATPYYLFHPTVPGRIARTVPDALLIALLRNPVDRAFSHHNHETRLGIETLPFEEAIRAENIRMNEAKFGDFAHRHFSYLARGRYIEQLLRFRKPLDEGKMLVLSSEHFFRDPARVLGRVLRLMGLPGWKPPPRALEGRNVGGGERMDPAMRRRLERHFEPHNRALYEYLGEDFGW